uniref:Protein kinase domain-containing protein n=1 Tax=Acrobeloides nanus TaxID=290746 RepID=A0A914DWV6_9BILA
MGCTTSTLDFEIDGHQISIIKEISTGGFSQIFLAQDISSKEKFAVKRITCSSREEIHRVKQEISIHKQLGHYEHVLRLVGAFEEIDPRGQYGRFSIVMPLCEQGSLYDELLRRSKTKNFMELSLVLSLFSQMCSAVSYLHHARPAIAHRDIKPGNFLFEKSNYISLIDFGSCMQCPVHIADGRKSRQMIDESAEFCSMTYRPPELFTCEIGTTLSEKIDIWSLGCVLYALCYFVSPFDKVFERGDSVALAAQSARLDFDSDAPYDASMQKLIRDILKVDPEERPPISNVQQMVQEFLVSKNPQNGSSHK